MTREEARAFCARPPVDWKPGDEIRLFAMPTLDDGVQEALYVRGSTSIPTLAGPFCLQPYGEPRMGFAAWKRARWPSVLGDEDLWKLSVGRPLRGGIFVDEESAVAFRIEAARRRRASLVRQVARIDAGLADAFQTYGA